MTDRKAKKRAAAQSACPGGDYSGRNAPSRCLLKPSIDRYKIPPTQVIRRRVSRGRNGPRRTVQCSNHATSDATAPRPRRRGRGFSLPCSAPGSAHPGASAPPLPAGRSPIGAGIAGDSSVFPGIAGIWNPPSPEFRQSATKCRTLTPEIEQYTSTRFTSSGSSDTWNPLFAAIRSPRFVGIRRSGNHTCLKSVFYSLRIDKKFACLKDRPRSRCQEVEPDGCGSRRSSPRSGSRGPRWMGRIDATDNPPNVDALSVASISRRPVASMSISATGLAKRF